MSDTPATSRGLRPGPPSRSAIAAVIVLLVAIGGALLARLLGIVPDLNLVLVAGALALLIMALLVARAGETERRLRDELQRLAVEERRNATDPLTGLLDRLAFLREGASLFAAVPAETPVAVLVLDVDRLRVANDLYGYAAGDALLRGVAGMLYSIATAPGASGPRLAGRIDGDAFALIVSGADHKDAARLAERARQEARHSTSFRGLDLAPEVNVGIAMRTRERDFAGVLRAAERDLETERERIRARPRAMPPLDPRAVRTSRERAIQALRAANRAVSAAHRDTDVAGTVPLPGL